MDVMEKMSSENRLIDADALIHRLLNTKIVAANLFQYANAVTNMIGDAPTIEAEPVRHGYWENANGRPKTYIRKCSVCGKEAYFCGRGCSYKFCPNCGSKMDGGQNNER